jgi:YidC/Oxa1 family membrane protein insertase
MSIITTPFAWLLLAFYNLVGNYGVAIILFAVLVKLILLPFQMKSKKSMMRMTRLTAKVKELEKKHEGNQRAYQQAVSDLYKSQKVNPMSGCLWNLIPFPILIALYSVIRQPMTTMMKLTGEQITMITDKFVSMGVYTIPAKADAYAEITLAELTHNHFDVIQSIVPNVLDIDYGFLGLNLGMRPSFKIWEFDWSAPELWLPVLGLFLIPIVSAGISYLTMVLSNKMNPQMQTGNEQQQKTMKYTMLMMPLVSVYICFIMPAALGIYWIAQGLLGLIQEWILNKYYMKKLEAENEAFLAEERAREEEIERRRQETERLRAEGKTSMNSNTSKKKLQAKERAKEEERRAAQERKERAERRARLGIEETEKPDSQVGNRRYARGRAYVPDRYTNPEYAEEATLAAAAESEFGESIDETVEDDVAVAAAADVTAETEEPMDEAEAAAEDIDADEETDAEPDESDMEDELVDETEPDEKDDRE